jgi:YD repeat-containing protein
MVGLTPVPVGAGRQHGAGQGGGQSGGRNPSCSLYPIAVRASALAGRRNGDEIDDLTTTGPPGHVGWLMWRRDLSEGALADSLTPPGDSHRYQNPDDVTDHLVSVGDWVSGRPGAVSSRGVRDALDQLTGDQIVLPVWDTSRGAGSHGAYRVSGFADVVITSYRLGHQNRISATYLGPSTCSAPSPAPVAQPTTATTSEDRSTTIVLTGSSRSGSGDLQFAVGVPGSGSVALVGSPACTQPVPSSGDGPGDGTVTCTAVVSYTPAADVVGADAFTFTVSDGQAISAPATVSIDITEVNDPPIPGADGGSTDHEQPLAFDVATLLANDVPGPDNESHQELTVTGVVDGAATGATVTLSGDTVTYTPTAGFSGSDTFTYRVCDDGTTAGEPDPQCADGTVTVLVSPAVNRPPVADRADVTGVEDSSVSFTLTGSDDDGDPLDFVVVTAPQHGTLAGDAPDLTYTPVPDFNGLDEFTFTVSDGIAASVPAPVAITVTEVNDPPIAGPDSVSAQLGASVLIHTAALLANDVAGPANESEQTLTLTDVTATPDTNGTVELADGTITYTPDHTVGDTATFTYTVCDDGTTAGEPDPLCDDAGSVTIDLAGANLPPMADDQTVTAVEDDSVEITLTGSDPEAAPLTFAIATHPANGSLVGVAPDLVYTPSADYFGDDEFTFTVSDGQASSIPATVSITVGEVNDPPAGGADVVDATGHRPASINVIELLANDTAGPANESTQTLTLTDVSATSDTQGSVSVAGGMVTYIPDLGFAGVATFTYTVCDNGTTAGAPDPRCSEGVVTVVVAAGPNETPLAEPATIIALEDTTRPITLSAFDADGDPLEFEVLGNPTHGTLSGTAPDLVYTPAPDHYGADQFTFAATDSLVASVPTTVTIDVREVNDPPVAAADGLDAVTDDVLALQASTLLANDVPGPANESDQLLTVTAVAPSADTHGTVSLEDGTVTYTPAPGFSGSATFTYTVCDDGTTESLADPLCTTGEVLVDVVAPSAPPIADPQSVTLAEDTTATLVLSGTDDEGAPLTFEIVTPPEHGTVASAVSPGGPLATPTTAPFRYTPAGDYFGADSFTFTVSDGLQTSEPATVSVTVTEVNDEPVLAADFFTLGGAGTLPPPPPQPSCGSPCGVIYGDPHLMSFDQAGYDAQAVGELIVAKSTTDDLEIQARFAPVLGSRLVSINTALAMRVAGHRVAAYRTTEGIAVNVDGTPTTVPATPIALPGGGTIGTYGDPNRVVVVWPDGTRAIVRAVGVYPEFFRFTVEIGLAPSRLGQVVGILGDADGDLLDDLFTRDGQPIPFPDTPFDVIYGTWVNSWRISNAESLFDYGEGETTATFTDLTFPDARATPQSLPLAARASATAICNLFGLTTQAFLDACIVDVGTTGDADFATTVAEAQESALGIASNAGTTEPGASTTVETTEPGETAVRTFTSAAGERLTMTVSGNTFTDGVDITVRGPTGSVIVSQFVDTPDAFRDVFTLPAAGSHTIQIDPRDQQVGSLTFLLAAVPENSGTTGIGTSTSVTTTVAGENATRTFAATAGQRLTLSVSDNTFNAEGVDITVRQPSGSSVMSLFVSGPTGFRDVFTLPVTGTYTVEIDPRAQQVGSLTFLLATVPDDTGTTTIGTPTTITTTVIGENATRTFTGTAGQRLTMFVSDNTFNAEGVDITVRQPSGSSVMSLFVSGPTGFRDVFTLPVTGTYTVEIDPRAQQVGSLTFLLATVPDNTGTTTIGTPTTITTTVIGENATRTFTGTAGQKLTMRVSDNTYTTSGVDITVRQPSGSSVASQFVSGPTAFRDVFTLPVTGTYTVDVDPRSQETGGLTFLLATVPDNTGTTTIGTPTTITTTVIGENATRTFTGTAGQKLTMRVSDNTYTTSGVDITVRQPSGSSVASQFVSGSTAFRDVFTLPVTGTYTVDVDPRSHETGGLTFLLATVPDNTGTTTIGTPTTITTTVIGENATRTFTGTAGQQLTLAVSDNTYTSNGVDITIRQPSGSSVASLFAFGSTAFRDVFTLPVTGTYTVDVDPRSQQTGGLTFLLADVGGSVAPASIESTVSADGGGRSTASGSPSSPSSTAAPAVTDEVEILAAEPLAAAGDVPTLTIPAADLLANDRPGPENESSQSLDVSGVSPGPFTHGTVTFVDGVLSYTPDADFVGIATFGYTACDDGTTAGVPDPRCSTGRIDVKVTANRPPVPSVVSVITPEDTPVGVTLSATDPDGDPITFVVATSPGLGRAQWNAAGPDLHPGSGCQRARLVHVHGERRQGPERAGHGDDHHHRGERPTRAAAGLDQRSRRPGRERGHRSAGGQRLPGPFDERFQTLTVTAVTAGPDTNGTVALAGDTITYVPEPRFTGTAVMAYTVCDDGTTNGAPDAHCADAALSIAANQAPTALDQSAQTSLTKPLPLVLGATDPDGDSLTYVVTAPPQHGSLTGTAPNLTYTADTGFVGTDSFEFTAADALGASGPATVSITVVDVPSPTLEPDSAIVRAGFTVLIDVLANDAPGSGTIDATTLTIAAPPTKGAAAVDDGRVRYGANAGTTGPDTLSYTVCDSGGGCATALVSITISENSPPVASADTYDVADSGTLRPAAPGVLANDTDPDTGDRLQARLVRGVTNGQLLLSSTGSFTYVPNGPGIDTFVYRVVDSAGASSNEATVTIYVTGPPGPPNVGNDLFEVQQGRELVVPSPGVLANDYSPDPRLGLTVLLQRDAAKGSLLLRADGTFSYTPLPGYTGVDQFSYVVRDSEGRTSGEARVGITVTAGGPPTATVGSTSPADGATILQPTPVTATLVPPPGESVTEWSLSFRQPGSATLVPLASGTGTAVAGDFDPTLLPNGTYALAIRALTSGGGVLVSETGVTVEGDYKPGRYTTTFRDVAVNSANIPIDLLRTYDSTSKASGDFGPGWTLELGSFRVESNGPLGAGRWTSFTCGTFPFLATCYEPSKPHFVTVTWPDGHVERFRFTPNQGSQLVPTITTAGFAAEPGTTSTLEPVGNGLLLSGGDFLLGDFFSADGIYDPTQFVLTDRGGTSYRIDRRAGLLSITDANGNVLSLGDAGLDSSSGISMTFVRDAQNRITRIAAPGGNIDYRYDAAGDLVRVEYPNGTEQSFTYDADHNLLTTSGDGQLVRTLQYDASGRVIAVTDAGGHTTAIDNDVAGRQAVVTDATGQLTTIVTYDDRGKEIRRDRIASSQSLAASQAGHTITTSATYDSLGRQLSSTDGLGHTTSQTYDDAGNVVTQTDANGETTTFTYNGFGQLLTMTDPLGHTTTNTYDSRGNLTSTTDANGETTTYTYDAAGNLLTTTDAMGRTTTRTYSDGLLTSITDPGGNVTQLTIDPSTGRLLSVTDPTGATTSYGYDAVGHLTSITDANGHTRSATYDAFDRITSFTDPSGASVQQVYDANGNLTSVTNRNGQTLTYVYDGNSRLTSKTVPGGGTTTFTYDAFGRLTAAVNGVAELAFAYDDADQVLTGTSTPVAAGALPTSTFTWSYDAAGNVVSTTGPGGSVGYGYDAGSRLSQITDPSTGVFSLGYDPTGRRTSMTRPNGITDSHVYNAAGDLTSLRSTHGATIDNQADYTYDAAGLRSSLTNLLGTTTYTYDGASRLTSATPPAGSGLPAEQYSYDPAGNRISSATSPLGSFTYDSGDRLLGDATHTYTYDSEGNLLTRRERASGATTTYTWTAEHQLVGITHPDGSTSTFRYDPLGRRVEIANGSATVRYAYDRQAIAAEFDGTNTLAATYVHPDDELLCPLEMVRDGERYFFLADGRRSTTALTDMTGATVASYRYEAFGTPLQLGSLDNPFLYHCIFVYGIAGVGFPPEGPYDPGSGQFLNDSPISFPSPNPFRPGNPMTPPADDGGGSQPGGGGGAGGGADEFGGGQCAGGRGPQIYPKGWKGLAKGANKLMQYPKRDHPKKGAGTEYVGLLPTQETVQAIADYGFIVRCQFAVAANALGP